MHALLHERLGQVDSLREGEEPRPQVVILALEKCRVVPQSVPVEQLSIDEHGRMEEGGAEKRVPAQRGPSTGKSVRLPAPSLSIEVDHSAPNDRNVRLRADPGQLAFEPLGHGDVVVVEPGDISAGSRLEAVVQRGGEPGLLLVPEPDQPLVADPFDLADRAQ